MSPATSLAGFVLEERVGVGGMAEVFRATRRGPGGFAKQVAIKRVLPDLSGDPRFINMFLAEARLAARFSSRNLVEVFDFGEESGTYYLVMEYVDGVDLATLLASGALDVAEVAHLGIELCAGLTHIHGAEDDEGRPLAVVHRDVSPANVLLSTAGDVKLGDFGIARARARSSRTADGAIKGKLAYLSPEQVRNDEVDVRTDVYGLGLCLFEALAGRRYLDADGELDLLRLAAEPPLRQIAELDAPALIVATLTRALAPEPERRYPSTDLFAEELRRWSPGYRPTELRRCLGALVAECRDGSAAVASPQLGAGDDNWSAVERRADGARTELRNVLAERESRHLLPILFTLVLIAALLWWFLPSSTDSDPAVGQPPPARSAIAYGAGDAARAGDAAPPARGEDAAPLQATIDARTGRRAPRRVAVAVADDDADDARAAVNVDAKLPGPDPEIARARELLATIDLRFKSKGFTGHDLPALSRRRQQLAAAIARGETPITKLDALVTAVAEITIDRHFVDAKLQRLNLKLESIELGEAARRKLQSHAQRALSHSVNGRYDLANRELNEIASVVEP